MLILYEMLHTCSVIHTQRRCKFENTKHRCLYHKFSEFNLFFIHPILFWIDELIHLYSIYISSMNIEFHYDMKITDDIFKSIFNESVWISITTCTISLKFIPKGPIDYKLALVQVVAWHRTGEIGYLREYAQSYSHTRQNISDRYFIRSMSPDKFARRW